MVFLCLIGFLLIYTPSLALDKKLSFALSHYIMATVYENLGDINTAIQEYQNSLKADYSNSNIHLRLAVSYIKNNNVPKAIEELNLCVKLDPEVSEPHILLALLYSNQNKSDLATEEYEVALKNASKLQPDNIDIYKELAKLYLYQDNFKAAEQTYLMILKIVPNDTEAHLYLANIYDELENRAAAIGELRKVLQLKPDYHEALNYLGYIYVEENTNLGEAEIMIKKALEFEPDNGAYVDSLGWLYFRKGKFREALKELERASLLLEDAVIYDHLGDAYFKLNNLEKAKINWQKSLELDPKQDKVKEKIEKLNQ